MTSLAMPATGAPLGEFGSSANWKITDAPDVAAGGSDWTTTRLRNVDNSSIRDALAMFNGALCATNSFLLFVAPKVSRTVEIMLDDGDVVLDWLNETEAGFGGVVGAHESVDEHGERPAVAVIRQLHASLNLPMRDLLAAAGVSKSTFHSWDKPDGPRPRLASQGRLWAFAEAVEDLAECLGGVALVGSWIAAAPARRALLRTGEFDTLLSLATPVNAAAGVGPYLAGLYAAGEEKQLPLKSTAADARRRRAGDAGGTSRRARKAGGSSHLS